MHWNKLILCAATVGVAICGVANAQTLNLDRISGEARAQVTGGTPSLGSGGASDQFALGADIAMADSGVVPSLDGTSSPAPEAWASSMEISGAPLGLNAWSSAQAVLEDPGSSNGGWLAAFLNVDCSGGGATMNGNARFGGVSLVLAGGMLVYTHPGTTSPLLLAPGTVIEVSEYIPSNGQVTVRAAASCVRTGGPPSSTNVRALAVGEVEEATGVPTGTGFNTAVIREPGVPDVYLPY